MGNRVIVFFLIALCSSCLDFIAAGSYNYVEVYAFNIDSESLKKRVNEFKEEKQAFIPVNDSSMRDGYIDEIRYKTLLFNKSDSTFFWGLILDIQEEPNKSQIYLAGMTDLKEYLITDNENDIITFSINRKPEGRDDLEQRRAVIKRFEEEVLSVLGLRYEALGNGMGIK